MAIHEREFFGKQKVNKKICKKNAINLIWEKMNLYFEVISSN